MTSRSNGRSGGSGPGSTGITGNIQLLHEDQKMKMPMHIDQHIRAKIFPTFPTSRRLRRNYRAANYRRGKNQPCRQGGRKVGRSHGQTLLPRAQCDLVTLPRSTWLSSTIPRTTCSLVGGARRVAIRQSLRETYQLIIFEYAEAVRQQKIRDDRHDRDLRPCRWQGRSFQLVHTLSDPLPHSLTIGIRWRSILRQI
jgi:hypothetical protein